MQSSGDFVDLLRQTGYRFPGEQLGDVPAERDLPFEPTDATTILAFQYADGVLVAGDRRATAGNMVLYDRADKVIDLDAFSVMAISGSPSIAFEIARILEHAFQYYRRRLLQEMSLQAKLRRLSLLIKDNLPMAMQGIGAVIPIFATYDRVDARGRFIFTTRWGRSLRVRILRRRGRGRRRFAGRCTI